MKTAIKDHKIKMVEVSKLKFDESNPNKMTDKQIDSLWKSIKKFGNLVPIIVNDKMQIADGEHRAMVYKEMGLKQIPAYVISEVNNDIQRRLLRQTMNKLKGQHEITKDANELSIIFADKKIDELAELIAEEQDTLMFIIGRQNEVFEKNKDSDEGAKEIGKQKTDHTCPSCGYTW